MDAPVNIKLMDRSNILVTEENAEERSLAGDSGPGKAPNLKSILLSNSIPIMKALVIIILFLVSSIGYSSLGCKTQYLMSSKFWYNKQIVIFFIIYLVVNLSGDTISKLTNPIQQLILSIISLLLYNIIGRLGEIWWNPIPSYWPGPMTWFSIIALPMIAIYILDDMKKYYMAENAVFIHTGKIDAIKMIEIIIAGITSLLIITGFYKATVQSMKRYKSNFSFISFLFGAPMKEGIKKVANICTKNDFASYKREITKQRNITGEEGIMALVKIFGLLITIIGIGFVGINYKKIEKTIENKMSKMKTQDNNIN